MMKRYHLVTGAAALAILLGQSSQVFGYAAYNAWGNYNAVERGAGCSSPAQASFGASSGLEAYDVNAAYWGYSYYAFWEESWKTSSNIRPYDSNSDSWAEAWAHKPAPWAASRQWSSCPAASRVIFCGTKNTVGRTFAVVELPVTAYLFEHATMVI